MTKENKFTPCTLISRKRWIRYHTLYCCVSSPIGFHPRTERRMQDFLPCRTLQLRVGYDSTVLVISSDMAQGSVPFPILYSQYISDLPTLGLISEDESRILYGSHTHCAVCPSGSRPISESQNGPPSQEKSPLLLLRTLFGNTYIIQLQKLADQNKGQDVLLPNRWVFHEQARPPVAKQTRENWGSRAGYGSPPIPLP